MVHGEPLTSLVMKAIQGDDESFCKSIQIDRQIYTHHPYSNIRISRAREHGESAFLEQVSYRLKTPTAKGRIRYPGVWTVLAMLDTLGWLDGTLTAAEILDICDAAGLELYENRIEDAGYMSKRIRDYRRMQKSISVSSHLLLK